MRSMIALFLCPFLFACSTDSSTKSVSTGSTATSEESSASVAQRSSASNVSTAALEEARARLEAAVPQWAEEKLTHVPAPSRSGPPFEHPTEVAQVLTSLPFEYVETRKNGREVFKNLQQAVTVKGDASRGYWGLLSGAPLSQAARGTFSLKEAEAATYDFFDRFNLPREEADAMVSSDMAGRASANEPAIVEARHVRIHRKINGARVFGSHLMVTYGLDGTPLGAEVCWPAFQLKESNGLRTRGQAVGDISQLVGTRMEAGRPVVSMTSEVAYEFDETERVFVPTLRVACHAARGVDRTELIRYSLIDGQVRVDF